MLIQICLDNVVDFFCGGQIKTNKERKEDSKKERMNE